MRALEENSAADVWATDGGTALPDWFGLVWFGCLFFLTGLL